MVIWWIADEPRRLSERAQAVLEDDESTAVVSTVSVWEMAIKRRLGKLALPPHPLEQIEASGVELLPITARHADRVASLPDHHGDPFDRLLVVQAQAEDLPVLTGDRRLGAYDVEIIW